MKIRDAIDSLAMRFSYSRKYDGLWLGVLGDKKDDHLICRVEEALGFIKKWDPIRFNRILRDVKRIWISIRIGANGEFNFKLKTCHLDRRFLERSSTMSVASAIVHEATHGYPRLMKIGYPEKLRYRIEQICMRQELLFAQRVPDNQDFCDGIERKLKIEPSFWSDTEIKKRHRDRALAALEAAGTPNWLTKLMLRGFFK